MVEQDEIAIYKGLAAPFPLDDLEWRVQHTGRGKTKPGDKAMMLPYVTARAVHDRLSTVLGVGHWRHSVRKEEGGWIARIEARIGGEWIFHEDGSPETDIEAFKGGISKAVVRCAVNFGVGAYLYDFPFQWVTLEGKGEHGYPPRDWKPDLSKIPPDCRPAKGGGRPATAAPPARQAEPTPPDDHESKPPADQPPGEPQPVAQVLKDNGVPNKIASDALKRLQAAQRLVPVSDEFMRSVLMRLGDTKKLQERGIRYAVFAADALAKEGERLDPQSFTTYRWALERGDLPDRKDDREQGLKWRDWQSSQLYKHCELVAQWVQQVDLKRNPPVDPDGNDYGSQGREP